MATDNAAAAVVLAALLVGQVAEAKILPPPRSLADWMQVVDDRLAAASSSLVPPLVPPVPVTVRWNVRRRAALELGAPLGTMTAADLDGDGRAELYVVSDADVIAYDVGATVVERARVALPSTAATIRPRDTVAVASLVPATAAAPAALAVRVASRADGARYAWVAGKLVAGPDAGGGFPLCDGDRRELVAGRDHFGTDAAPVYGVSCRADLVDKTGATQRVVATLLRGGTLRVEVTPPCGTSPCKVALAPVVTELAGVGVGFAVADVDRDGAVDVIVTGAGAPGDADAVRVIHLADASKRTPWFRRAFSAGVVAVAVGDFDGDGDTDVVCATRLLGSTRIDLWQLNT